MRHTRLRLRAYCNISQVLYARSVKLSAPFQSLGESVCLTVYFKDFDGLVRRTCCKAAAVIVEDSIMLESQRCQLCVRASFGHSTHTIMSSWPELDMTCACGGGSTLSTTVEDYAHLRPEPYHVQGYMCNEKSLQTFTNTPSFINGCVGRKAQSGHNNCGCGDIGRRTDCQEFRNLHRAYTPPDLK